MSIDVKKNIVLNSDFYNQILKILEDDASHLADMNKILEMEHNILRRRNFHALTEILGEKNQLIKLLHRNKQQKNKLLNQIGILDEKPLNFIQSVLPETARKKLAQLRQQINRLIQQNSLINQDIGKQLNRNQVSIKRVIDNLQGKQNYSTVYSANGKTSTLRSDSYLAQA